MRRIGYFLRQFRRLLVFTSGAALIILFGSLNYRFNQGLSFLPFYLIPVSLVAWLSWRWTAVLLSVISAITWIFENAAMAGIYQKSSVAYWNTVIDITTFFIITAIILSWKSAAAREKELESTDGLTGILNRKVFYDLADAEINRLRRYKRPFTAVYIDIDNFKMVNYRLGYNDGDNHLRSTARMIKNTIRESDIISRFGGDEFAILLPETGAEAAQIVLSRIRNKLSEAMQKTKCPTTFSFGAVTFLKPPESAEEIMKRAGSMMYSAKSIGTNVIEQDVYGKD